MQYPTLTQERPTEPIRADCGHLCNCYQIEHENETTRQLETWYRHDVYDNATDTGSECGTCYRARMEAATAHMTLADVTRAFAGR